MMTTPARVAGFALLLLALSVVSADAWPRCHHHPTRREVTARDHSSHHLPVLPCHAPQSSHPWYRRHVVPPGAIHVHDGDTFYVGAETIRLRGIDTPELGHPKAAEATRRLIALLSSGPVTIVPRAEDVYSRTVADVYVAGRDVADILRREGFEKPRTR